MLLSLLPLLDRDAAAAIAAPLQPQLRRLGLTDGEPSRRKRPRYGGRGGEDADVRGAMGGLEAATEDSSSSEDEGDVGEVEGTPTLPSSPMSGPGSSSQGDLGETPTSPTLQPLPGPGSSSQGDLGETPTSPTLQPLPGPGSSSQGDLGETPTNPTLQPFFSSQASQGESQASQGGSQRYRSGGYAVDSRGRIISAALPAALTCSVKHLPSKTPQETVRYATGEDTAKFVTLAARLLQPPADGTTGSTKLPDMVARLADTANVCQPLSPCPPPTSDNLAAWDCRGHLKHILCLLHVASRVTLLAQYHVGGFLRDTLSPATTSRARHEIVAAIATAASLEDGRRYRDTLASCGCQSCTCALRWLEGGARGSAIAPCRKTEVATKFAQDYLVNATPTFFRQCIQLHGSMPGSHPVLSSAFETPTISPTHVRLLVAELHSAVETLQLQHTPLPLPMGQLGLWAAFQVEGRCEEAIDWVDGDGGYLVASHLPGMLEWVRRRAPNIAWSDGMRGTLVPFRCHGHDAAEVDHVYHGPGRRPAILGYQALCAARRAVAEANRITIYTQGEVDAHGKRLVCDVTTITANGTSTSTGEALLRAGLSHPLPGAPTTFLQAFEEAKTARVGLFSVFPGALATSAAVQPVALRATLTGGRRSVTLTHDGNNFKVTNRSIMRHASHMLVWTSALPNAGQGAFVRSRSPHQLADPFIRKDEVICGYGSNNITGSELDSLTREELEYALTVRQRWHYNAYRYNGENIGRYLNQGGLREALGHMVHLAASRDHGRTGLSQVENEAERHCNATFDYKSPYGAVVVATRDIWLGPTPTELYINYGIQVYWLPYLAYHAADWGLEHEMVRAVLWCATSQDSSWPPDLRRIVMDNLPAGLVVPPNLSRPTL